MLLFILRLVSGNDATLIEIRNIPDKDLIRDK